MRRTSFVVVFFVNVARKVTRHSSSAHSSNLIADVPLFACSTLPLINALLNESNDFIHNTLMIVKILHFYWPYYTALSKVYFEDKIESNFIRFAVEISFKTHSNVDLIYVRLPINGFCFTIRSSFDRQNSLSKLYSTFSDSSQLFILLRLSNNCFGYLPFD